MRQSTLQENQKTRSSADIIRKILWFFVDYNRRNHCFLYKITPQKLFLFCQFRFSSYLCRVKTDWDLIESNY